MIGYKLSAFNFVLLFRKFPIVSVENILYLVQDGFLSKLQCLVVDSTFAKWTIRALRFMQ
jgi:hypothetical protein